MKFDVIVGNPPYQKSNNGKTYNGSAVGKNSSKLWPKIVESAYNIMKHNGIMTFITPSNYTQHNHPSYKIIFGKLNLKSIDFNANNYFLNVKLSNITSWIAKKENRDNFIEIYVGNTLFNIEHKMGDIFPEKNISKEMINLVNSVFNNSLIPKINLKCFKLNKNEVSLEKKDDFSYRLWDAQKEKFANKKNDDYNKPKLMISEFLSRHGSGPLCPLYKKDLKGEYLTLYSNRGGYIVFDTSKEVENAYNFYTSNLFKKTISGFTTSTFMKRIVLEKYPVLDFSKSWTDQELYKYFNLTQEEIDYIEKNT